MPVILDPVDYDFWLDPEITEPEALKPLLVPHSAGKMAAYPVTKLVCKPSYNNPDAIKPLNEETS